MIVGVDGNEANLKERVGVNQYAFGVLNALYYLPEGKKHKFIIYLRDNPLSHMPKSREGWEYRVLSGGGLWVIRRLMFNLWFGKDRPDVLFTPSHYVPLFVPMPVVMSVMDLGYLDSREQFRKRDFYQLKYWGWWSMFTAKRIIAISESTKKDIVERYPWAKRKVEVVYPGYDGQKVQSAKLRAQNYISKVKTKFKISGDYVLFLSTLKPSKNVEGVLEAFSLMIQKAVDERKPNNLLLVIAGKKGWLYESVFEKVRELGLENFVVFTDFVKEEDKTALLAGAEVLVAPSFWEGFGMHVLEAMAVGTPVVVSRVGGLPEVAGGAGVYVDANNSQDIAKGVEKALKNRAVLSKRVAAQAMKFGWEKAARETLGVLEEVV